MSEISLRSAEINDCGIIFELLAQMGYEKTAYFAEHRFKELLDNPNEYIWIAERDDEVLGFFSMHIVPMLAHSTDFARLSYLCVDERLRSSGIGKILLGKCEQIAKQRNCNRVELHSNFRREGAHRFYLREGYEEAPKYFVKYT